MRLINYDVLPGELLERAHAEADTLEGGQTHIKLARLEVVLQLLLTLFLSRDQVEDSDLRAPQFEFLLPVWNHSLGHDNQKVAFDLLELS